MKTDYGTPDDIYKQLDDEFHFNFDPCPFKPTFDGLMVEWKERNYVNPPYGKYVKLWIGKAINESRKGHLVVILLPSRTDTAWFHDGVLPHADEIRFIRGRLKFKGAENSAPFPSMIIIFRGDKNV